MSTLSFFNKYLVNLFIIVFILNRVIEAQSPAPSDTLRASLEAIEVRAAHSAISSEQPPFSLSMLTNSSRQLTHKAPITMDDLFTQVPGIWINDRENYALGERITVRGVG
ncbi:hypothetical protein ACG2E4_17240, partial [Halalkalibaculum sp. DA384]